MANIYFTNARHRTSLASTSTSGSNPPYDVFINHRGPDTKLSIASHLYNQLHDIHGLQVFLDKEEMNKGDFLPSQIAAAIAAASVHIAIFSPGYANSEWCLNELLLMLKSMESGRSTIIPIFYRVKPADLRWTIGENGVYAEALSILQNKKTTDSQTQQEKPRYNSNTIKKWRTALFNASQICGFDLESAYNGVEWQLVNDVVQQVLQKVKTPALDVSKYPTGLDKKLKDFEELLQQQSGGTKVVGIVGFGGIGKTTLAKEIFNSERSNYKHSCFLFDIRENSLITLQSELINNLTQSNEQIRSIDEGKGKIRRKLSSKQALIVLDNVDHAQQLEALLLPAKDVLHSSSLILVTSRDKQVLINEDIKESAIYKLDCLNQQHSLELFCWHAFGQPRPVAGFKGSVTKILNACGGLPLSLTVLGAHLRGRNNLTYWTAQLRKISKVLPNDIQSRVKISYDSLDEEEKQIFLDTACFFIGEHKDTAIRIWDESGLEGWLGFQSLENKCLVEVDSENNIRMHDHLRDLGRDIGKKELPYRLSSLSDNLLRELPEKSTVRGINMVETSIENRADLGNRLLGMRGLELVRAEGDCLDQSIFRSLQSQHLIWLRWDSCPYSSLPPWIPMDNLRVLELKGDATLEKLWWEDDNFQGPLQLRELNITGTLFLEIPKSIGKLKQLEKFDLESIWTKTLPHEFCHLQSLKHLRLMSRSMESLPDSFGNLTSLQRVDLYQCSRLKMLPDSFGELRKLQHINLSECSELRRLPDSSGNLRILQHIDLSCCATLKRLPGSFGELKYLQHINLSECSNLESLPNFCNFVQLQHLDLSNCVKLNIFPETLGKIITLEYLNLSGCRRIEVLPPQVAHNRLLLELYLCGTNLKELPSAIGDLSNLQVLFLGSELLESLPSSICNLRSLQELELWDCSQLKCLPYNIGYLRSLRKLKISGCIKMERLPDSIGLLTQLRQLKIKEAGVEYLPPCVMEMNSLEHLKIKDCPLNELPFRKVENGLVLNKLDASIVKCMLRLKYLKLFCIKISAVSFSEGVCPNLQHLLIYGCDFLVEVGALPKTLINLNLIECPALKKMGGLSGLEKLENFILVGCDNVEDLPGLETLICLEELTVNCHDLKSIEGLAHLTRLQVLDVENCSELPALPGLEHLTWLRELQASGCRKLRSIEGLTQLTKLEVLNVEDCYELDELPGLVHLTSLSHLDAGGCGKLQSIRGLAQLTGLELLNVTNCCELKELRDLEHLTCLRELNASGCGKLQSIEGLEQLTALRMLNVANCCELKELPNLEHAIILGA